MTPPAAADVSRMPLSRKYEREIWRGFFANRQAHQAHQALSAPAALRNNAEHLRGLIHFQIFVAGSMSMAECEDAAHKPAKIRCHADLAFTYGRIFVLALPGHAAPAIVVFTSVSESPET